MDVKYTLIIFFILAFPLIFLGYGSDNDSYGVLDAGSATWNFMNPTMSRNPGYWLYEFAIHFIDMVGGFVATNFLSLFFGVLVLHRFLCIAISQKIPNASILALCLGLNPWFLIAATSTMDYMVALFFIVISSELVLKHKFILMGIASGLAIGARLGSIFPLTGIYLVYILQNPSRTILKGYLYAGLITIFMIFIFYYPSWVLVGKNFSFLKGHMGDDSLWSIGMYFGRFFYKIIYLFGFINFLFILVVLIYLYFARKINFNLGKWSIIPLASCIGNLILFASYPIEISYLLPFLFFYYLLIGVVLKNNSRFLLALILVATLSYSFVNISIAKPNIPGQASKATLGISIEEGVLIKDVKLRLITLTCNTFDCWLKSSDQHTLLDK